MAITGEKVSHVALSFGPFVVHSVLLGVQTTYWLSFEKKYTVEAMLTPPEPVSVDIDSIVERYDGSPYDFGGLLYLGLYYFCKNRLGLRIPGGNYWASKRRFMCTEFASQVLESQQESMVSPKDLEYLLVKKGFRYCDIRTLTPEQGLKRP